MKTLHVGGLNPIRRYKTLALALSHAQDDDVIEIHKNLNESVLVDKNVIIKGHQHTLKVPTSKAGFKCQRPLEIHQLDIKVANRANAISTNYDLILDHVRTYLDGPVREFYPTVMVVNDQRRTKVQFDNCSLVMTNLSGQIVGEIDHTEFRSYYHGNIMLSDRADMNRLNGNLTFNHCTMSSTILGHSYLDNQSQFQTTGHFVINTTLFKQFVDIEGQATINQCELQVKDQPDDAKQLKKEPTNGPLQNRIDSKYGLALRAGAEVTLTGYQIDGADPDFLGIFGDRATLNLKGIHNDEKLVTNQLINTTLSCEDTDDQNYWDLQGGTLALVRSKLNSNTHYETAQAKLDQMIGQNTVKEKIKSITNTIAMNRKNHDKNFQFAYNMVFAGDPGTGKTTFAEIVAQALFEIGAIPQNKFTKATNDDLVEGYVGQTAKKTRAVLDKALGGVLFIDEAYELTVKSGENTFNDEALGVIIRYMEDHRSDLIVIAAGYTKEMKEFLASNVGLERRFQWIEFEDYTPAQMTQIFELMRKSYGDQYENPDLSQVLTPLFQTLTQTNLSIPDANGRITNGGNGGLVRNVYQSVAEARNNRVIEQHLTDHAITKADMAAGFKAQLNKALNRRAKATD